MSTFSSPKYGPVLNGNCVGRSPRSYPQNATDYTGLQHVIVIPSRNPVRCLRETFTQTLSSWWLVQPPSVASGSQHRMINTLLILCAMLTDMFSIFCMFYSAHVYKPTMYVLCRISHLSLLFPLLRLALYSQPGELLELMLAALSVLLNMECQDIWIQGTYIAWNNYTILDLALNTVLGERNPAKFRARHRPPQVAAN